MDGQLGISEIFLGFVDPVFSQILVQGFSCVLLEQLAKIKLGEIHLLADGIHRQLVHIVLIDISQSSVDDGLLHWGEKPGFLYLMGHNQQLMDNLVQKLLLESLPLPESQKAALPVVSLLKYRAQSPLHPHLAC